MNQGGALRRSAINLDTECEKENEKRKTESIVCARRFLPHEQCSNDLCLC